MEFTLIQGKNKIKGGDLRGVRNVSISKNTLKEVINLLSNVECTCVWSDHDNEYIKINDISQDLVDELVMIDKLS